MTSLSGPDRNECLPEGPHSALTDWLKYGGTIVRLNTILLLRKYKYAPKQIQTKKVKEYKNTTEKPYYHTKNHFLLITRRIQKSPHQFSQLHKMELYLPSYPLLAGFLVIVTLAAAAMVFKWFHSCSCGDSCSCSAKPRWTPTLIPSLAIAASPKTTTSAPAPTLTSTPWPPPSPGGAVFSVSSAERRGHLAPPTVPTDSSPPAPAGKLSYS